MAERVVILGAGHAGGACAVALRRLGFAGEIALVGDEALPPYERPSISKQYLTGAETAPHFVRADWALLDVALHLGTAAVAIDGAARRVTLADGSTLGWDRLVIATGGRPRPLPAVAAQDRVFLLRTTTDADAIRAAAVTAGHAVIIGGGVIGLEVAASLKSLGLHVTVIERAPQLMARNVPPDPAAWIGALHEAQGTSLLIDAALRGMARTADGLLVTLSDGREIGADFSVIGIGIRPAVELARDAGLAVDDGILVDGAYVTSHPAVLAIGDVARRHGLSRHESWAHAESSARTAARGILGQPPESPEVPWFWTDQFGHRLQIAGDILATDEVVHRAARGGQVALYLRERRLHGIAALDAARDFAAGRRLIASGDVLDLTRAADPGCDLRRTLA